MYIYWKLICFQLPQLCAKLLLQSPIVGFESCRSVQFAATVVITAAQCLKYLPKSCIAMAAVFKNPDFLWQAIDSSYASIASGESFNESLSCQNGCNEFACCLYALLLCF
jgi:hypothetical protein